MPFSQSPVNNVRVRAEGPDLFVSWDSAAPGGSHFQVYVDRTLTWFGTSRCCHVPVPAGASGRNIWVDVGQIGPAETRTDFSGNLRSVVSGAGVVELTWPGGTYLDPSGRDDLSGFRVYGSRAPGQPVDPSAPLAEVAAYPGGWVSDGFGMGAFGQGGFGRAASRYVWQAGSLAGGVWTFRVNPVDRSGTERGAGQDVVINVNAAPRPPAKSPAGARLNSTYSGPESRQVTLVWNASPSA